MVKKSFISKILGVFVFATFLTGQAYNPGRVVDVEDLADDTADHVLGWDGSGVAVSQSRDGVRAFNNANVSISNSAWVTVPLDSEIFDDNAMHSTSTDTGRLTATIEGRYLIVAQVRWATNSTGFRGLRIVRGAGLSEIGKVQDDAAAVATIQSTTTIFNLAADDFVQMQVFQTSGGSLNVEVLVDHSPEFMMQRLRAQ